MPIENFEIVGMSFAKYCTKDANLVVTDILRVINGLRQPFCDGMERELFEDMLENYELAVPALVARARRLMVMA
jgi:hypothetical protein